MKGDNGSHLSIGDALTHPALRKSIIKLFLTTLVITYFVLFLLPTSRPKQNYFKIVANTEYSRATNSLLFIQLGWVGTAHQDFNVNKISTA